MKALELATNPNKDNPDLASQEFLQDAVALFTSQKQGHMERWEYGPSLVPNDPAGGSEYWAALVKNPGDYYLTQGDIETIQWSLQQDVLKNALSDVTTVVELGPGSHDSIQQKTLPFLLSCPKVDSYTAIDVATEQASEAAATVSKSLSIHSNIRTQDYFNSALPVIGKKKSAVVMWGSSLGNIDGSAGEDPSHKLKAVLNNFKCGLKNDDLLILCFDTETRQEKVIRAYSEINMRSQILSILHRLRRDKNIVGNFDPRLWQHEALWVKETLQCAHTIYPIFDQEFYLNDHLIKIPAWSKLISNNSYKFKPETIISALNDCGMETISCFQKDAIALIVTKKS